MATIYPEEPAYLDTASDAEKKLYPYFAALPDKYTVFCNRRWHVRRSGAPAAAEADFLVAHPDRGVLVVEVKGGLIARDPRRDVWTQNGRELERDPFAQVQRTRFLLRDLWARVAGRGSDLPLAEGVFFPDCRVRDRDLPEAVLPKRVLDGDDVDDLEAGVIRAYEAFGVSAGNAAAFGPRTIRLLTDALAGSIRVRRHIGRQLADAQDQLIQLTENQYRVLSQVERHRRVCVVGGAGTGKTLLAVAHARRLAAQGKRVMVVCFNSPLAGHIRSELTGESGVQVFHFHLLCRTWAERAGISPQRPPDMEESEYYDVHLPALLTDATGMLEERFDAVIVDEAQDFQPDWLAALELLLADEQQDPMVLLADENQAIYQRDFEWPEGFVHFPLYSNLRNTAAIHGLLVRHFDEASNASGPEGLPVQLRTSWDAKERRSHLSSLLSTLTDHGVLLSDITVLTGRSVTASALAEFQKKPLGKFTLSPKPAGSNQVRFESVHRFKGLESPVVVLCEMEEVHPESRRHLWYTALSRAQAGLFLIVLDRSGEVEGLDVDDALAALLKPPPSKFSG